MPTVTLVERQKRNKERVNVYLDNEFAFSLNELDAASLHKGQQLTEVQLAELRHRDEIVKAVDAAVKLLSFRPRSTQEIRQRLQQKSYESGVIEAAIERLQNLGYLDDRAFARFWIEERNRSKPRGERALRSELRNKGIADALIRELLDEIVDENHAAYQAARPRALRLRGLTRQAFQQKIGSFLQRRGFSYEAVHQAIDDLKRELNEADSDFFVQLQDEPD